MRPEVSALGSTRHDLLVIGGGILGACLAWDAALRGLKVALVERGELGGATSANSLRIIHGGLRCLVRGGLRRMRESIRERSALLRIAPGLVQPFPVAIPTGIPGYPNRAGLRLGLALNDFLSAGRNRHLVPSRQLPAGRALSAGELTAICPGLGPLARAGEPYGLTPSCLAPDNLPGRLCARPQNTAAYWPSMPAQNVSPAAEGGSSQWQSGIVRAGASRRLRPSKSFLPRARGPVSCWRGRLDRPWLHGKWFGTPWG